MLEDFQSLLEEIFAKEGIDLRLVDVKTSSVILYCEASVGDVRNVRRIVLAKRSQLNQRGIVRIDLEYYTNYKSMLVSFL